ncbi:Ubiquinone hydroxylase UbiM [Commensalibacter sp. Nvir]|uniref:5-demethoxyubiquinol-8 5-hydroxylase UbiM n=1 Tax=Commensalibacter sp. Nvir TaxID=3069817 RepID=UPI002D37C90D|nr:Ubiquinone hydroxylase UbiM [Commensalibacter sp. Nvir]
MLKWSAMRDVIIIGGGPAGLSAALTFENLGLKVTVIEPAQEKILENPPFDGREIALTHHSVKLMQAMGVWDRIDPREISILKEARVENGSGSHPLTFDARGKGMLGYFVPNYQIRKALFEEVQHRGNIKVLTQDQCKKLHCLIDSVRVEHKGDTLQAGLAIVSDGRFSKTRERLGIGYHLHDFRRHMMVCRMRHEKPHHNIALQWFDKHQTLAILPLNGNVSSIVLSLPPDEMAIVNALDNASFNREMTKRLGGRLGQTELISTRHVYPLKTVFAHRFETRHTALIGDTAVGMHPITAHGFNFALIAQEILADEVKVGLERGENLGAAKQLNLFEKKLRIKTLPLFTLTNAIATLYTREEKGIWQLRRAGLNAVNFIKPLKSIVIDALLDKHADSSVK